MSKAEIVRQVRAAREALRGIERNLYGADYDPLLLEAWAADASRSAVEVHYGVAELTGGAHPPWCEI